MKANDQTRSDQKFEHLPPSQWDQARLKQIVAQFEGKKVLIIGDIGVDRYVIGAVERISPEAPVPIVMVQQERLKLGLAANVADNVRTFGADALLLGVVGVDRAAEDFRKILKQSNISDSYLVEDSKRRTVLKERIVSERQQLLRVDYESTQEVDSDIVLTLMNQFKSAVSKADAVILEDYCKGALTKEGIHQVFEFSKQAGKAVAVDPNIQTPWERYIGASLLTPNKKEAEALSGVLIHDLPSLCLAGQTILNRTQADSVVITRGVDGMALFQKDFSRPCLIPTFAREVYDVSGAGDTVVSVLTLALSCGATLYEAGILGNLAAGVEVSKRGTATVTPQEIFEFMTSLR